MPARRFAPNIAALYGAGGGGGGPSWGTVSATAQTTFPGNPLSNAFDGSTATLYANNATGETITVTSSSTGGRIRTIALKSRADGNFENQTPSQIVLQGSNDDSAYTTVDTQTYGGFAAGGGLQSHTYTFAAYVTNYKYHRLVMTSSAGAISFSEMTVTDDQGTKILGV